MSNPTKKQKLDDDASAAPPAGQGGDHGTGKGGDLAAVKSMLEQLLDHSRGVQSEMKRIREEIGSVKEEMKAVAGERNFLRNQVNALHDMHRSHGARFDNAEATQQHHQGLLRNIEETQRYHKVLLKNRKWEYEPPVPAALVVGDNQLDLIKYIRRQTCRMRYGQGTIGDVTIWPQSEDIIIAYDDIQRSAESACTKGAQSFMLCRSFVDR